MRYTNLPTNTIFQAEFLYKIKPKLPNQFKAAETNGVPFAVIMGEDEIAKGLVKIKEMGLKEGHPEKDGVDVKLTDLVNEIRLRIKRKAELDSITQQAEGLRVIGGIRGESDKQENERPIDSQQGSELAQTTAEDAGAAPTL